MTELSQNEGSLKYEHVQVPRLQAMRALSTLASHGERDIELDCRGQNLSLADLLVPNLC